MDVKSKPVKEIGEVSSSVYLEKGFELLHYQLFIKNLIFTGLFTDKSSF